MQKIIKLFLRLSLGIGFLSAVADRLGLWPIEVSTWGTWQSFLDYTQILNPWFPSATIPTIGFIVTALEVIFAICLIVGFKTALFARLSGYLLLIFAFVMFITTGIKGVFDYSVLTAAAGAFAINVLKGDFLELDKFLLKGNNI
jgi:uncharacterized membrane protein YphA (DoxX/SURF4 family)